jgi:hypothetical protein
MTKVLWKNSHVTKAHAANSPSRLGAIPDYVGKSFKCALIVAT